MSILSIGADIATLLTAACLLGGWSLRHVFYRFFPRD